MPRFPVLSDVDVYGPEPADPPSDEELYRTDHRAYIKRLDRRLLRARQRVLHQFGVPTELLQVIRLLADPGVRAQVNELCASVDVTALGAALRETAAVTTENTLQDCGRSGCKNVVRGPATSPWPTHEHWCPACLNGWFTRASEPPRQGIASALNAGRRVSATLTDVDWAHTVDHFQDRCAYCGGPWCLVEHLTPTSRGGGTSLRNCVPACTRCNGRKHNRTLDELGPDDFYVERLEKIRAWLARA